MNEFKARYARKTDKRTLAEAMEGADIFFGLSTGDCVTQDMVKQMAPNPLILAMANPNPEIHLTSHARRDPTRLLAQGDQTSQNQVNNVLCFPFLFRGALDCGATTINDEMKIACAYGLVDLAQQEASEEVALAYDGQSLKFGPDTSFQSLSIRASSSGSRGGRRGCDEDRCCESTHRRHGRLSPYAEQAREPIEACLCSLLSTRLLIVDSNWFTRMLKTKPLFVRYRRWSMRRLLAPFSWDGQLR